MSRAIFTVARAGGFAARVWSIHNLPRSTVNSMSCASRKCFSSRSATCDKLANSSGRSSRSSAIFKGVRMPATTSSPCAFGRYSPYNSFAPVSWFLVNATPVPESDPMLPNTIIWTFAAVPRWCGILLNVR